MEENKDITELIELEYKKEIKKYAHPNRYGEFTCPDCKFIASEFRDEDTPGMRTHEGLTDGWNLRADFNTGGIKALSDFKEMIVLGELSEPMCMYTAYFLYYVIMHRYIWIKQNHPNELKKFMKMICEGITEIKKTMHEDGETDTEGGIVKLKRKMLELKKITNSLDEQALKIYMNNMKREGEWVPSKGVICHQWLK